MKKWPYNRGDLAWRGQFSNILLLIGYYTVLCTIWKDIVRACIVLKTRVGRHAAGLKFKYGTFLTLSLKLMQWYVTSVSCGSLYEKFGNKCVKILKFWRIELSHAQNKNRGTNMRLLGMDTCPSLNDIMEIRCNKCTRSEQGYDF
jgi:hypothetical protein